MAQAQIEKDNSLTDVDLSVSQKKRKITFNINTNHYISIFKNETGETTIKDLTILT